MMTAEAGWITVGGGGRDDGGRAQYAHVRIHFFIVVVAHLREPFRLLVPRWAQHAVPGCDSEALGREKQHKEPLTAGSFARAPTTPLSGSAIADRSRRSAAVRALGKSPRQVVKVFNSTVGPTVRPCLPHKFPKPHFLRAPPYSLALDLINFFTFMMYGKHLGHAHLGRNSALPAQCRGKDLCHRSKDFILSRVLFNFNGIMGVVVVIEGVSILKISHRLCRRLVCKSNPSS